MTLLENRSKLVLLLFFCFSAVLLNREVGRLDTPWVEAPTQRDQKMDPRLFRTFTFGHYPAAVDWLLIRTLADSGLDKVAPGTHPSFYYDLDLASDLDPAFFELYTGGANLLAVVRGDMKGALNLLLKGDAFFKNEIKSYGQEFQQRFWDNAWSLQVLLAYVYLFGMDDMPHAAEAFRHAAELPHAPQYLLQLEKRLSHPSGEYEVGLKLLNFMIGSAKEEKVRDKLIKQRLDLFVGQFLFETNHAFQKFLNSQPGYRSRESLSADQMGKYWKEFRRTNQVSEQDPWGGKIHLDSLGRVVSTTPHEPVFGLR